MNNVLADGRLTHKGVVCGCHRAGTTARLCRSGVKGEGGQVSSALAHPLTTPIPYAWPVVCGCCQAGTTARANALTHIVF